MTTSDTPAQGIGLSEAASQFEAILSGSAGKQTPDAETADESPADDQAEALDASDSEDETLADEASADDEEATATDEEEDEAPAAKKAKALPTGELAKEATLFSGVGPA